MSALMDHALSTGEPSGLGQRVDIIGIRLKGNIFGGHNH